MDFLIFACMALTSVAAAPAPAPSPGMAPRSLPQALAAAAATAEATPNGAAAVARIDGALTLHGDVRASLEQTLARQSPRWGRALAAEAARLLRWRGKLGRLVRPHDRIDLLYLPPSSARLDPRGAALPTLVALRYRGERLQMDAYLFAGTDGIDRYYDGDGELIEPHMVNAPVPDYAQITEVVQHGRGLRQHRGDDLKAAAGAPVVLPFAGRVTRLDWRRRVNGRCIEVQLDAGYTAHFLHLQSLAPGLHLGQHLPAGAALGAVGNTGHSSGPHLHYELLRRNAPVEPLLVHGRRSVRLGPQAQAAFLPLRDAMAKGLIRGASPAVSQH